MNTETPKTFPIHRGGLVKPDATPAPFLDVPWDLIASHRAQCLRNHAQSPETLARRGGLDPTEMLAVIHNESYYRNRYEAMTLADAFLELEGIVASWETP